ncbi:MAG: hypothetical protein H0Z33_13200 [Bacillaceae bacterium]|nr:hypothetical protein [Bacillaceae bacterium]
MIREEDLKLLPEPVQTWLKASQVVGKEYIRTIRLKQKGMLRTAPDKNWMPFTAEQYFTTQPPAFLWKARVKFAPFLFITGKDKYVQGRGNMRIKLLSLFTLANARGDEMDQGTMIRYLGEITWFPTAALSNYVEWESIDSHSAKATMHYGGVTASGIFTFDNQGKIHKFTAERYMERKGTYSLETWSTKVDQYKEFGGFRIPARAEVTWHLDSGDFTSIKLEISNIKYNEPEIHPLDIT